MGWVSVPPPMVCLFIKVRHGPLRKELRIDPTFGSLSNDRFGSIFAKLEGGSLVGRGIRPRTSWAVETVGLVYLKK